MKLNCGSLAFINIDPRIMHNIPDPDIKPIRAQLEFIYFEPKKPKKEEEED